MATYAVKVKTRRGVQDFEIDAPDERAARKQLKSKGTIISLKKQRAWKLKRGMNAADRQEFLNRLAMMLQSKVGSGEALRLLQATYPGTIKRVSADLLRRVESGAEIADAIEAIGLPDFPETTCALIKAGSRGGSTWQALAEAAEFEREMAETKRMSGRGILSAVAGFITAIIFLLLTVFYFAPWVKESPITSLLNGKFSFDNIDLFTQITGVITVLIFLGFGAIIFLTTFGKVLFPVLSDKITSKIPIVKDIALARTNYSILYGLSLLVRTGVRIETALSLSGEAAPKGVLKTDLQAAKDAVHSGKPWAPAMSSLHPTDIAALSTSLDREHTSKTINSVAQQYRRLYSQKLTLLSPVLMGLAAFLLIVTGFIFVMYTIYPMLVLMPELV